MTASLQGPIDIVVDGEHTSWWPHYFSTPCLHDLHAQCKGQCKFCEEQCRCDCHKDGNAE